jgi:hypothetical protein
LPSWPHLTLACASAAKAASRRGQRC